MIPVEINQPLTIKQFLVRFSQLKARLCANSKQRIKNMHAGRVMLTTYV
jgi:hypothetical protein